MPFWREPTVRASEPPLEDAYPRIVAGRVTTAAGSVPRISTEFTGRDRWGALRVRLNIRRMDYAIAPGLYAVGSATAGSPVFVSANYKLSFDTLRRELSGLDAWILVLDTKGINVWCAAGKGTFGTEELVRRVEVCRLSEIVSHRELIVPQLGAPGVAAHSIKKATGFKVIYGPVRACDIKAFLGAGGVASPDMRRVRFPWHDRLAVVPVDLLQWARYLLPVMAAFVVLAGIGRSGYSVMQAIQGGSRAALLLLAGYVAGGVLSPVFLPWLPGRAFAEKGAWMGAVVSLVAILSRWLNPAGTRGLLDTIAWCLLIMTVSSFMAMGFTGASTYTSLSGVKREMRVSIPLQIAAGSVGVMLWVLQLFVG